MCIRDRHYKMAVPLGDAHGVDSFSWNIFIYHLSSHPLSWCPLDSDPSTSSLRLFLCGLHVFVLYSVSSSCLLNHLMIILSLSLSHFPQISISFKLAQNLPRRPCSLDHNLQYIRFSVFFSIYTYRPTSSFRYPRLFLVSVVQVHCLQCLCSLV